MIKEKEYKIDKINKQKQLGGDIAGTVAAAGVLIGVVAVSGSVSGLSAAGITSGLATLGFGYMASGIAVVAGIGLVSFLSVKWICKKL